MRLRIGLIAFVLGTSIFLLTGFAPDPVSTDASEGGLKGSYLVDTGHSMVIFDIRHLGVANFYGRFNEVKGKFRYEASPDKCEVKIDVSTGSVDTNSPQRDRHLKSADFFDSEKHPAMTFESEKWIQKGKDSYEVAGQLTLLGQTKPMTIRVDRIGSGEDIWGGYRTGFEARFTVKRSEYGMTKYLKEGALGDNVNVIVSLEGILEGYKKEG